MIVKEMNKPIPVDRFGRAGAKAEKQMAFYLRRAFSESCDIFVFNDLRFVRKDEVAQIDHLVLHRFGFFLIESKSVTGSIEVNNKHEFVRVFDRKRTGIKSPIAQVAMQAQLLQKLLNDNKEKLRRKVLLGLRQGYFGDERFGKLVAVSDSGEIKRVGCDPPELVKADRVVVEIEMVISQQDKLRGLSGFVGSVFPGKSNGSRDVEELPAFTKDEFEAITKFLMENDEPADTNPPVVATLSQPAVTPPPFPEQPPKGRAKRESPTCRHCGTTDIEIVYGKYGYYFRCRECSKNTTIGLECPGCGNKAKISKKGREFNWKCSACDNDDHFFTNPS